MFVVVGLLVAGFVGVLLYWSYPGQPAPFVGQDGQLLPGSISEKVWVEINGVPQGMFIRGRDATKPVLLFLHGGMPEYFLAEQAPRGLEDLFVVCWWEQRGAGLSYRPDHHGQRITTAQLAADAIEVARYLRGRFHQERIYLMAHSGGTFLGMRVVAQAPELFHAYIGVAQISNQLRSEKRAYDYMLEQYRQRGDRAMVGRLERAPVTAEDIPPAYLTVRDDAMHRLGIGTTREMRSVRTGFFLASLRSRAYTLPEKINLWRGKAATGVSVMWDDITTTDLATAVPKVDVPVYFFHGAYDYTCTRPEAEAYFERLEAPLKGFYLFWNSAHSPMFEEPDRALDILREDVLAGRARLADQPGSSAP